MIAAILTLRTPKTDRHIQPSLCIIKVYGRGAKGGSIQLTARTVTPPQKWYPLKSRGIENAPKTSQNSTNRTMASKPSVVMVGDLCIGSQIRDKFFAIYFAPDALFCYAPITNLRCAAVLFVN